MTVEMVSRDLYLRHTDADGKCRVVEHRVWDADLFLASQQQAAAKINRDQKGDDAPRLASVQQITHEQYLKERTK